MSALVAFIEARLQEAENHARKDLHMVEQASNGGAWEYGLGYNLPYSELGDDGSIGRITSTYGRPLADGEPDQHNADTMLVVRMVRSARSRAERMLRDVGAKRQILAAYLATDDHGYVELAGFSSCSDSCPESLLEAVLRVMAGAWADHPDYLAEWTP